MQNYKGYGFMAVKKHPDGRKEIIQFFKTAILAEKFLEMKSKAHELAFAEAWMSIGDFL